MVSSLQHTIYISGKIVSNTQKKEMEQQEKKGLRGLTDGATSPDDIQLPLDNRPITVVINSTGGDVFAGSEIYTLLREYRGRVTIRIMGIAASIASVIAMAGDRVEMSPTAQMMIHNVSVATFGNTKKHEETIRVLENLNNSLTNAYHLKTGKTKAEIRRMMEAETWLTAQRAKQEGFVDSILFEAGKTGDRQQSHNSGAWNFPV